MRYAKTDAYQPSAAGEGLSVTTKYTLSGNVDIEGNVQNSSIEIGNTINADISGITPVEAQATYQWWRDGEPIDGQTSASYLLVPADIGHSITVALTGIGEYHGTVISAAATAIKNTVAAPEIPQLVTVTDTTIEVVANDKYEYSIDLINWTSSNIFTGLDPNTEYSVYQRVVETATTGVSEPSVPLKVTTLKTSLTDTPAAPTVESVTNTVVVLANVEGYEYRVNDGEWQVTYSAT